MGVGGAGAGAGGCEMAAVSGKTLKTCGTCLSQADDERCGCSRSAFYGFTAANEKRGCYFHNRRAVGPSEQVAIGGAVTAQLLLGLEAPAVEPRPRRHQVMIRLHGRREGRQCRSCARLVRTSWGRQRYLKCEAFGVSASATTDWRAGWEACGLCEERE